MDTPNRTMSDLIDRIEIAEIERAKFRLMAQRCEALIDSVASLLAKVPNLWHRLNSKAADSGAAVNIFAGGKRRSQSDNRDWT